MRDHNQGGLPDMEQQNEELGEESAESEEGRGIRQFDAGEEPAQLIIDTEQNVE